MSDVGDLIQSADVYECFDSNTIEVEYMIDYLVTQRLTPRHIYREIVSNIQSQPRGFVPLIELELFVDVHAVASGIDPNPDAARNRICRLCATEVLLWGLREWWVRERQKGFLQENVLSRKDCPEGSGCGRQKDLAHAREFNHIVVGPPEPGPDTDRIAEAAAAPPTDAPAEDPTNDAHERIQNLILSVTEVPSSAML
jgi:E3 ubiquitin-protein ligase CHFR